MGHGKGAGTTEPAPVGPAGDVGPIKPGGTNFEKSPSTLVETPRVTYSWELAREQEQRLQGPCSTRCSDPRTLGHGWPLVQGRSEDLTAH
jgi:hypothetical protein